MLAMNGKLLPSGQPDVHPPQVMEAVLRSVQGTWVKFSSTTVNTNDFVNTPANGLYEVHTIPKKGRGVVAARDIKAEEIVLHEIPILLLAPEDVNIMLFFTLPRKALEAILLLHNAQPNIRKYSGDMDIPIHRLMDLLQGALDTNCFDTAKAACGRLGVLLLAGSLFNHDDSPNVDRDWDDGNRKMVFTSSRDVKKGEELVFDYLPGMVGRSRVERLRGYRI